MLYNDFILSIFGKFKFRNKLADEKFSYFKSDIYKFY